MNDKTLKKYTQLLYTDEWAYIVREYQETNATLRSGDNVFIIKEKTLNALVEALDLIAIPGYQAGLNRVGATVYIVPEQRGKYGL